MRLSTRRRRRGAKSDVQRHVRELRRHVRGVRCGAIDGEAVDAVSALEEYEKLANATKMGSGVGAEEKLPNGLDALREGLMARVQRADGDGGGLDLDGIRMRVVEQLQALDVAGLEQKIEDSVKNAVDVSTLTSTSETFSAMMSSTVDSIKTSVTSAVSSALSAASSSSGSGAEGLADAISSLTAAVEPIASSVAESIAPLKSSISAAIEPLGASIEPLVTSVSTAVEPLGVYIAPIWSSLNSALDPLAVYLEPVVNSAATSLDSVPIAVVPVLLISAVIVPGLSSSASSPIAPLVVGFDGVLDAKRASAILSDWDGGESVLLIDTRPEKEIAQRGALVIAVCGLQVSPDSVRANVRSRVFPGQSGSSALDAAILSCVIADLRNLQRFARIVVLDSKGSAFAQRLAKELYARRPRRSTKVFTVDKGFESLRKCMIVDTDITYEYERSLLTSLRRLGSGGQSGAADDGGAVSIGGGGGRIVISAQIVKLVAISSLALVAIVQWKTVLEVIGILGLTASGVQQLRTQLRSRADLVSDDDASGLEESVGETSL